MKLGELREAMLALTEPEKFDDSELIDGIELIFAIAHAALAWKRNGETALLDAIFAKDEAEWTGPDAERKRVMAKLEHAKRLRDALEGVEP